MTRKKAPLKKGQKVRLAPRKVAAPEQVENLGEPVKVVSGHGRSWTGKPTNPASGNGTSAPPQSLGVHPNMVGVPFQDPSGSSLILSKRDPLREKSVAGKLERLEKRFSQEIGDAKRMAHGAQVQQEWMRKDNLAAAEDAGRQANALLARIEALELAVHGEIQEAE